MQNLPPPEKLRLNGNKAEEWQRWKQRWEIYLLASGLISKTAQVQTATFLHVIGQEGLDIYNNFKWDEEGDNFRLNKIVPKFEAYFIPKRNVTFERHIFNSRKQLEEETTDEFVGALQKLVRSCDYGDLTDSIVKDRIVAGLKDENLRAKLLEKTDLTLDEAVQILKAVEATKEQVRCFRTEDKEENKIVESLKRVKPKNTKDEYKMKRINERKQEHGSKKVDNMCQKCGNFHGPRNCPAIGKYCYKCQKPNHYSKMCKTFFQQRTNYHRKQVAELQDAENSDQSEDELFLNSIYETKHLKDDWTETVHIYDTPINFKLDTGAQCSVLPKRIYDKLSKQPLRTTKVKLKSYTKEAIYPVGQVDLLCTWRKTKYKINFQVVEGNFAAILGKDDCVKMRMIHRAREETCKIQQLKGKNNKRKEEPVEENIFTEFADVFEGLGKLPGEYKIELDQEVKPVIHAPRKVPHSLQDKLKIELQDMIENGIIEKVPNNEPSEWVNSLVTVEKPDGNLRICIDPRDLNKGIKREHHPITTVEDIAAKVKNAKYFTTLDAKSAYHQVVMDKESSKLLTFNSPFGRHRYLRMPFGLTSSGEVYQRRVQEVIEGLDGVDAGMDDILVWGDSETEHDERLRNTLQKIRDAGMKLKKEKCKIKKKNLKFHGHEFTDEGLKALPTRCKAIRNMPTPQNKEDLKRFLGMINYVGKFIPNLSNISAPLRELLKKETEWCWSEIEDGSFQTLKNTLQEPPVLRYYNPKEKLTLQVDASSKGVGAALIQNGNPVAYASKALTNCQQGYAQIEKEMLAILFGCTKFENFIIGRDTLVETDHKPLESIMKKPLCQAPVRLQRMMIQLLRYPGINVIYKKGKDMHLADALSRAHISEKLKDYEELQVDVMKVIPMSDEKFDELVKLTAKDETMSLLKSQILEGWPTEKKEIPQRLSVYWNYRDELTVQDELIFKGSSLVIPTGLRKEMLKELHQSHLGIALSKRRAREILFWPGMNAEIEDMIRRCDTCATHQRANSKETLNPHEIPERPWSKIATDLFYLKGKNYLMCVDCYSKYPEIVLLSSTTSEHVICALKSVFARHGIPDEVISDQGPQFTSFQFKQFAKKWSFKHSKSSPHYPKSNGQAERSIQTVKNILKKADDPYLALLEFRNTPIDAVGYSPAQLLMNRRLKSILPISIELLKPELPREVVPRLKKRQNVQKYYYDKNAKDLPELKEGDDIQYSTGKSTWEKGRIAKKLTNRSYEIHTSNGKKLQRNRIHLKKKRKKRK